MKDEREMRGRRRISAAFVGLPGQIRGADAGISKVPIRLDVTM
jgi:hypothetical protein